MVHSYIAGSILVVSSFCTTVPFIPYFLLQESIPKCEELKHDNSFSYFGSPIINNQIPLTTKSNSKTISDKVTQPEKQVSFSRVQSAVPPCSSVQFNETFVLSILVLLIRSLLNEIYRFQVLLFHSTNRVFHN